jgi:hypothetical protein
MHAKTETLAIGWCDNGETDGKFTEGLFYTFLKTDVKIVDGIRVNGNQIGRQRETLIREWAKNSTTDWLLWVDSDIVLTSDVLKKLWDTADKVSKPVVTGVYFISKENEQTMMMPMPCIFLETGNEHELQYIHPMPDNEVIKVDCAGMGLVLMHRTAVQKVLEHVGDDPAFGEKPGVDNRFISEDIVFFRYLKEAGVPVYAHTGAQVQHMKRFSLDVNYYHAYWTLRFLEEQQMAAMAAEQEKLIVPDKKLIVPGE